MCKSQSVRPIRRASEAARKFARHVQLTRAAKDCRRVCLGLLGWKQQVAFLAPPVFACEFSLCHWPLLLLLLLAGFTFKGRRAFPFACFLCSRRLWPNQRTGAYRLIRTLFRRLEPYLLWFARRARALACGLARRCCSAQEHLHGSAQ